MIAKFHRWFVLHRDLNLQYWSVWDSWQCVAFIRHNYRNRARRFFDCASVCRARCHQLSTHRLSKHSADLIGGVPSANRHSITMFCPSTSQFPQSLAKCPLVISLRNCFQIGILCAGLFFDCCASAGQHDRKTVALS